MSNNIRKTLKISPSTLLERCSTCVFALLILGCVNNTEFASLGTQSSPARTVSSVTPKHYKVQKGDTLYSIAWRFKLDMYRLAATNKIKPPYTIHPGQTLSLRLTASTSKPPLRVTQVTKPVTTTKPAKPPSKKPIGQKTDTKVTPPKPAVNVSLQWSWPHNGKIVRTFGQDGSRTKGVDMAGRLGDSVNAAAAGKVVFAGSGLRGYGNLIIIEHNENWLSAYGFNRKILVVEQQTVTRGQKIAEMGIESSSGEPLLHFEIRKNGKPVDPVRYLPKR